MVQAGSLSQYFSGVGVKSLTGTEVVPSMARSHEFQCVDSFRAFLGTPGERTTVPVKWAWLSYDDAPLVLLLTGTWYVSRRGQGHRGPEYRRYYPAAAEDVVYWARAGDTLFLSQTRAGELLALQCPSGSSIEQQRLRLFGLDVAGRDLVQQDLRGASGRPNRYRGQRASRAGPHLS